MAGGCDGSNLPSTAPPPPPSFRPLTPRRCGPRTSRAPSSSSPSPRSSASSNAAAPSSASRAPPSPSGVTYRLDGIQWESPPPPRASTLSVQSAHHFRCQAIPGRRSQGYHRPFPSQQPNAPHYHCHGNTPTFSRVQHRGVFTIVSRPCLFLPFKHQVVPWERASGGPVCIPRARSGLVMSPRPHSKLDHMYTIVASYEVMAECSHPETSPNA